METGAYGGDTVTKNGWGLHRTSGAVFESAGDNTVHNNANTTGTITSFCRM